jgi:hypothetical protein
MGRSLYRQRCCGGIETLDEQTELLREMRDLLRVIAEPALAERDKKLRASLLGVVGKSEAKAKAVRLMDGSRSQTAISKESGVDQGLLSRLEKSLRSNGLLKPNEKNSALLISIPPNFFKATEEKNG